MPVELARVNAVAAAIGPGSFVLDLRAPLGPQIAALERWAAERDEEG